MKTFDKKNIRYNILSILVYFVGIVIIIRLFSIQIIRGQEFLEKSNSRLTRETVIKASRGNILDCKGTILAGTKINYSLEIYKSKITVEQLNRTILNVINILEKNSDKYSDNFPISVDPIGFTFATQEEANEWLKANKFENDLPAEDVLNKYIEKYELKEYELQDARKILSVRYRNRKEWIYKYETIHYFKRNK